MVSVAPKYVSYEKKACRALPVVVVARRWRALPVVVVARR